MTNDQRDGHTALHAAGTSSAVCTATVPSCPSALCDHAEIITLLVKHGATVNTQDVSVITVMSVCSALKAYVQYEGLTPLHWAFQGDALRAAEALFRAGADPTIRPNVSTFTLRCRK